MTNCPVCGEYMYVDEEWRLRRGVPPVGEVESGDYVHADCWGDSRDI